MLSFCCVFIQPQCSIRLLWALLSCINVSGTFAQNISVAAVALKLWLDLLSMPASWHICSITLLLLTGTLWNHGFLSLAGTTSSGRRQKMSFLKASFGIFERYTSSTLTRHLSPASLDPWLEQLWLEYAYRQMCLSCFSSCFCVNIMIGVLLTNNLWNDKAAVLAQPSLCPSHFGGHGIHLGRMRLPSFTM